MITCRNAFLALLLPLLFSNLLFSQEQLTPLQNNPAYLNAEKPNYVISKKALSLPFIDDFSTTLVYPDTKLWIDNYVYINTTIAKNPPTIGVASFDGLNGEGQPWSPANIGEEDTKASQPCDTLTSQAIDLSSLDDPTSLYLSFFYQSTGFASKPETNDSLILEVKTETNEWETLWRQKGVKEHEFKSVILHVGDSVEYLHNDFQFRFINYATPTGYNDFWHVDYIELDEGRSASDTTYKDLAFVDLPTSIFKDYSEMTIDQFFEYQDVVLNQEHSFTISNLDKDVFPSDYYCQIEVLNSNDILYELGPLVTTSVPAFEMHTENPSTLQFTNNPNEVDDEHILINGRDLAEDTLQIEMKYIIDPNNDERNENDTISRVYTFKNQLAYDDGIVDVGYGVSGEGAQIAQKYEINQRDDVQGVLIHFARINLNQTDRFFTLKVWESLNGVDGSDTTVLLGTIPNLEVIYPEGDNHTGYTLYCFEDEIDVIDKFYIGIQQEGSVELHLGFDRNNDSSDKLFFNTFNQWLGSAEKGSVMMRPVVGNVSLDLEGDCNISVGPCPIIGNPCKDQNDNDSVIGEDCTCIQIPVGIFDSPSANLVFTILPNPANDYITLLNLDKSLQNSATIEMMDATGKLIKSFDGLQESLYIGDVPVGIYFIRITNEQQQFGIKKLIKTE